VPSCLSQARNGQGNDRHHRELDPTVKAVVPGGSALHHAEPDCRWPADLRRSAADRLSIDHEHGLRVSTARRGSAAAG
jgi:hypothetical protein